MGDDFKEDREACLERWVEVNDEDHDIIQRLYQGHRSPGFSGAKFAPDHEETIYAFQKLVQKSLQSEFDIIKESHRLHGDPNALQNYYRGWADTYDRDVCNERYAGPRIITDIAVLVADLCSLDRDAALMDAGCGTGLVGIELSKAGFRNIAGFDLSEEMAIKAKNTKAYRAVTGNANITELPSEVSKNSYDLVLCCGVFTTGHIEPEAFSHLLDLVKPGGHVIFSARRSYMNETNFEKRLDPVLTRAEARIVLHLRNVAYIAEEGVDYWVVVAR